MGLLTPCSVPRGGLSYTMTVPGEGFCFLQVVSRGGWFWMKLIPALTVVEKQKDAQLTLFTKLIFHFLRIGPILRLSYWRFRFHKIITWTKLWKAKIFKLYDGRQFLFKISSFRLSDLNNKKRSHTQLDSRKQVIAFQDTVITINIKEAQHPLK